MSDKVNEKKIKGENMLLQDKIYKEFTEEVSTLKLKADMSAVAVVGELTRALKRVTNRNGGTAYEENGQGYDINNKPTIKDPFNRKSDEPK